MDDRNDNDKTQTGTASRNGSGGGPERGLGTKHIVLILGIVLIVAAAVVTVILLTRDKPADTIAGIPVINADNLADVEEEIREKVEKGMFVTHMNTMWTFPDGESPSDDAVMGNSSANSYPFWFELISGGEVLFE